MSIMVATGKAATKGVLFRDAAAIIENFRKVDTLIVDKTGTDRRASGFFEQVILSPDLMQNRSCVLPLGLDQGSEHPLAHAIVDAA